LQAQRDNPVICASNKDFICWITVAKSRDDKKCETFTCLKKIPRLGDFISLQRVRGIRYWGGKLPHGAQK